MLYALHNEDGSIHQANKLYVGDADHKKYADLLNDQGHKFVTVNSPGILPAEHWYVKSGELSERPIMDITVSKTQIKCGDKDNVLFTNCPKNGKFRVIAAGSEIWSGVLDATELQISMPVPCVCKVLFDYWPFKTFTADLEFVA